MRTITDLAFGKIWAQMKIDTKAPNEIGNGKNANNFLSEEVNQSMINDYL